MASPIPFAKPDLRDAEVAAVTKVIRSGMLTSGQTVTEFEDRFAQHIGVANAVAVTSCTLGFQITLAALGVAENTTVVSPTNTFTGPSMMAHHLGATVELLDSVPDGFVPRLKDWVLASRHADVIMPVHFAGQAVNIKALTELTSTPIVDDAAHALVSRVDGNTVGAQGATATVFSFYVTKPLCTGNGGMVVTNDDHLAKELRSLRLHGMSRDMRARYNSPGSAWDYDIQRPGWKANMTDMAAAMGIVQLDRLAEMQRQRTNRAKLYMRLLYDCPGVRLPYVPGNVWDHSWHLFPILVQDGLRDKVYKGLGDDGINASMHFIPLHKHSAWKKILKGTPEFPNADAVYLAELSLPIYSLMTDSQVVRVAESVRRHAQRN